jgi:hypothetical protein
MYEQKNLNVQQNKQLKQVSSEGSKDSHPAEIIQRFKICPLSNTQSEIIQLQKSIGTQEVIQPMRINRSISNDANPIQRIVAHGLAPDTRVYSIKYKCIGTIERETETGYMVRITHIGLPWVNEHTYAELEIPAAAAAVAAVTPEPEPSEEDMASVDSESDLVGGMPKSEFLAALDRMAKLPSKPLGPPRIRRAEKQFVPKSAVISKNINGNNNDCVIAAFRTARPGVDDTAIIRTVTSTEDGINLVARVYGMRSIEPRLLPQFLKTGKTAFINAHSLGGASYHAYAALGMDESGMVIAWDTDNDEHDIKLIPIELIWLAFI